MYVEFKNEEIFFFVFILFWTHFTKNHRDNFESEREDLNSVQCFAGLLLHYREVITAGYFLGMIWCFVYYVYALSKFYSFIISQLRRGMCEIQLPAKQCIFVLRVHHNIVNWTESMKQVQCN